MRTTHTFIKYYIFFSFCSHHEISFLQLLVSAWNCSRMKKRKKKRLHTNERSKEEAFLLTVRKSVKIWEELQKYLYGNRRRFIKTNLLCQTSCFLYFTFCCCSFSFLLLLKFSYVRNYSSWYSVKAKTFDFWVC